MYPRRGFWTTRFSTRNVQSDLDGSDDTQGNRAEIICGLDCVDAGEDASPFHVQDRVRRRMLILRLFETQMIFPSLKGEFN